MRAAGLGRRPRRDPRRATRSGCSHDNADIVVAGARPQQPDHGRVPGAGGLHGASCSTRATIPGGGAATEELLGPGYLIDSCSTGHTLIQTNPLLLDDELGLQALRARVPRARSVRARGVPGRPAADGVAGPRPHGRGDRALLAADAAAYRRLLDEYDEVKHIFAAGAVHAARLRPVARAAARRASARAVWLRRRAMSAWDVIRHEFEEPHIQAFLLWQAYQTLVPVDAGGSGQLAYSLVFGRQRRSRGRSRAAGPGALTDALVRCIGEHGGTVLCNRQRVTRLLVAGGRCAGVETDDGARYHGERRAVVSTIHVKHLLEMAPGRLGRGFRYGVETFDVGVSAMACYMATDRAAGVRRRTGPRSAVSAGLAGFPRDVIAYGRALRDGRYVEDPAWLLVACPTLADPSRAPEGHHTVKLLSAQSWVLRRGSHKEDARSADRQLERVRRSPGLRRGHPHL